MSDNLQLKSIASAYADGEIDEAEFIRRVLDELAYQHSTSFWCKVMEMKDKHDYATRGLKE
jgi:hypothetical protein